MKITKFKIIVILCSFISLIAITIAFSSLNIKNQEEIIVDNLDEIDSYITSINLSKDDFSKTEKSLIKKLNLTYVSISYDDLYTNFDTRISIDYNKEVKTKFNAYLFTDQTYYYLLYQFETSNKIVKVTVDYSIYYNQEITYVFTYQKKKEKEYIYNHLYKQEIDYVEIEALEKCKGFIFFKYTKKIPIDEIILNVNTYEQINSIDNIVLGINLFKTNFEKVYSVKTKTVKNI